MSNFYIPLEKNIRELLKDTIYAHPDDIKKSSSYAKASTPKKKKKKGQ